MIIKINSPLQRELQAGDKLLIPGMVPDSEFEILQVKHAQDTEISFETPHQNYEISQGALLRTPFLTWRTKHSYRSFSPQWPVASVKLDFQEPPEAIDPDQVIGINYKKIKKRLTELAAWHIDTQEKETILIQNLGGLLVEEVLQPIVKFAEENLLQFQDQFFRLTFNMWQVALTRIEETLIPYQWEYTPAMFAKNQETVLELLREHLLPIVKEIITKTTRQYEPLKRPVRRHNAPWALDKD